MLVLARKQGEAIVIDKEIVVTVLEIRKDRVRLGIQATADIRIDRMEIWVKRQEVDNADS